MVKSKRERKYPNKNFIRDMWNFIEGFRLRYLYFVFVRILSELAPFGILFYLGTTVDFFATYQPGDSLNMFYFYLGMIAFLGAFQAITRTYSKLNCSVIGAKVRQKVRQISMARLMDLELEWHEKEGTGSKLQKINQGAGYIYRFFSDFTNNRSISVSVGIIGSLAIFFVLGLQYALFAFAYIAIFLMMEKYYSKKLAYWTDKLNKINEKVSGKFHESTSNVLSVKSLGLRSTFEKSTKKYEDEYYKIWLHMKKTSSSKGVVTNVYGAIGYALFILLIGFDFVSGAITVGSILVFALYFNRLRASLSMVSGMVDIYIDIKSAVGRLMTILGKKIFDRESEDLLEVPKNWKSIEFKNINFSYKKKSVLRNFSLKIKRGEKIGIVGRSGCGKSTLTKLLLGLYKVNSGEICIDGININLFKHSSITNTITPVLQDSEMFNLSLEGNITISTPRTNEELLNKSIRISALSQVIATFPRGLRTMLGEKGYKVSGGERQRIGIARAIYKNSSVMLLDEATSHLDSKTELHIQECIEKELHDKTLIVIAHRPSTLKNVDRIIVMEKGKVVESGTFNDLVRARKQFYSLYRLQARK